MQNTVSSSIVGETVTTMQKEKNSVTLLKEVKFGRKHEWPKDLQIQENDVKTRKGYMA